MTTKIVLHLGAITFLLGAATNCGYHVSGKGERLKVGARSIGIPTLRNRIPQIPIELRLTQALIREFAEGTRLAVTSKSDHVDLLLDGEVTGVNAAPIGFSREKFGSTYLVIISLRVKLTDLRNQQVMFQDDNLVFRNEYIINSDVSQFFSEENFSIDRMAKDFASTVLTSVLENF